MGRQLRRVPLDFNWPLDKVWKGFINPFYEQQIKCEHCDGSGSSPDSKRLESLWYAHQNGGFKPEDRGSVPYTPHDPIVRTVIARKIAWQKQLDGYSYYGEGEDAITREATRMCALWNASWSHHLNELDIAALLKADRLWDFTRRPRPGTRKNAAKHSNGWLKKGNGYVPTPREVNDWSLEGMAHDSINCSVVIAAELKRLKLPTECSHCKGVGHTWPSKSVKWHYEHWKQQEPPIGDAYQVWETVSEGSPISPPFATPEELAAHMAGTRWGADKGSSYETWMAFILGPGWALSMMSSPRTGLISGVEAVTALK